MAQSLFDQFRRFHATSSAAPSAKVESLRVQLCFDADGSYVQLLNERGDLVEPDYQGYSGALRNLLRSMQQLRERNGFVIDWENPSAKLYLHQYDYLLDYVRQCPIVIDERQRPVTFAKEPGELKLQIKATDSDQLDARIRLLVDGHYEDDFLLLNERYVLSEGRVIEINEVGPAFNRVPLFDTSLAVADLTKYLSLALSNLENIQVEYDDYRLQTTGTEPIMAQPCLIFEKIDADQSLYVRVTQQLPQTDAGFLDEFDLFRYADINPLERIISVRIVERQPLIRLIDKVSQLIDKHTVKEKGKRKSQGQYIVEGNLFVLPQDVAGAFIYQELPQLLETFQLFGAEKLKQYRISTYPPRLNLSLSHGIDFLEIGRAHV